MSRTDLTLGALALRCSPGVIAANPAIFPEAANKADCAADAASNPGNLRPDADGLVLRLPGYAPKGANRQRGAHWSTLAAARRLVRLDLARALNAAGINHPPQAAPSSRWQLHYIRCGVRPLDGDNLAGAYKSLQDAIVAVGLIPDDSWAHLRSSHDQRKVRRGEESTIVYFRRLNAGEELRPWNPDIECKTCPASP